MSWGEVDNPLICLPYDRYATISQSNHKQQIVHAAERMVSLEMMPPWRSRHPQALSSLVQELD
jgi:hypothetical protein